MFSKFAKVRTPKDQTAEIRDLVKTVNHPDSVTVWGALFYHSAGTLLNFDKAVFEQCAVLRSFVLQFKGDL